MLKTKLISADPDFFSSQDQFPTASGFCLEDTASLHPPLLVSPSVHPATKTKALAIATLIKNMCIGVFFGTLEVESCNRQ